MKSRAAATANTFAATFGRTELGRVDPFNFQFLTKLGLIWKLF